MTVMTIEEWLAEGHRLFGDDRMQWKFVCPSCGHIASVQDWKDAGAPRECVAFSCIGRFLPNCHEAFGGPESGPCNYAGGGLFAINPIHVKTPEGIHQVFAFAEIAANTA